MKIQPKTEKMNLTSYERIFILDHEETSLIRFWDVFYDIWLKISFYNLWWKVCLMEFTERKHFEVRGNNAWGWENKL